MSAERKTIATNAVTTSRMRIASPESTPTASTSSSGSERSAGQRREHHRPHRDAFGERQQHPDTVGHQRLGIHP